MVNKKLSPREKRHKRIRSRISGTTERPRLCVHISNKNIYAQIIDDLQGVTLVSFSSNKKELSGLKANVKTAAEIGKQIAQLAVQKNITKVVFDRSGYQYHGRLKSLADSAREAGLQF
jgi:large subunit ribosomal protein L18